MCGIDPALTQDIANAGAVAPGHGVSKPYKGDKRYVRRTKRGRFSESDDVGRSLAADPRKKAKTVVKKGEGDKGDQPRRKAKPKKTTKAKRR